MAMIVQHNITAMNANRNLNVTTAAQAKSTEKLSTGYKINRAADDASGLSISEKMRRQVRGLTQASSNAQDGISSVQTAEGALTEVHDMLQRMDELATKAANGTLSQDDRQNVQDEIDQLLTEIDRVSSTTKFNEIYLLSGDKEATTSALKPHDAGIKGTFTVASDGKTAELEVDLTEKNIISVGGKTYKVKESTTSSTSGATGGFESAFNAEDAVVTTPKETVAEKVVADGVTSVAIGDTEYNIVAKYGTGNTDDGYTPTSGLYPNSTPAAGDQITIGDKTYTYGQNSNEENRWISGSEELNATKMKEAVVTATDAITVKFGSDEAKTYATAAVVAEKINALDDESTTLTTVTITGGDEEGEYKIGTVSESGSTEETDTTTKKSPSDIASSLNVGNIVAITKDNKTTSYIVANKDSVMTAVEEDLANGAKIKIGDTEYAYGAQAASPYTSFDATNADGSYWSSDAGTTQLSNDELGSLIETALTAGSTITLTKAGETTGTNYATADAVKTAMADAGAGATVSVFDPTNATTEFYELTEDEVTTSGNAPSLAGTIELSAEEISGLIKKELEKANAIGTDEGAEGKVDDITAVAGKYTFKITSGTINHQKALAFNLHVGSDADMTNKISVNIEAMDTKYLGISNLDVVGKDDDDEKINDGGMQATYAIDAIEDAIKKVSQQRSQLGAVQNRLEHTIKNLDNIVENTAAAESEIRDTNMATEMVQYSKNNILSQAGQSMLAQANQSNQGVLSLLG